MSLNQHWTNCHSLNRRVTVLQTFWHVFFKNKDKVWQFRRNPKNFTEHKNSGFSFQGHKTTIEFQTYFGWWLPQLEPCFETLELPGLHCHLPWSWPDLPMDWRTRLQTAYHCWLSLDGNPCTCWALLSATAACHPTPSPEKGPGHNGFCLKTLKTFHLKKHHSKIGPFKSILSLSIKTFLMFNY